MKLTTLLLSLLILALSIKPCSDGTNAEDLQPAEIGIDHNHQNDSDDSCPITCVCNCCGRTITYQPILSFTLEYSIEILITLFCTYQSIYRFDFHSNIWQPPQLIS